MAIYLPAIQERFLSPKHVGKAEGANGIGAAAAFVCGSFVRFSIRVSREQKRVASTGFQTNGCGYMIAAADVIAASIEDRLLSDLHALNNEHLGQIVDEQLGEFPYERVHCLQACFEAVHGAFADYRALQIEEFKGEKVLICTCFGVTEDVIEETLDNTPGLSVEKVGDLCNAGTGCGSCQMLIQEMIEDHERSAGAFDGV